MTKKSNLCLHVSTTNIQQIKIKNKKRDYPRVESNLLCKASLERINGRAPAQIWILYGTPIAGAGEWGHALTAVLKNVKRESGGMR